MQRITISINDELSASFDDYVTARAYGSRSEAVRDILRDCIETWREEKSTGMKCVANFSYVYDRRIRNLAQRLSELQHANHNIVASSTIVRLDHYFSMESIMLKGKMKAVRILADNIRAQRGVRFGTMNIVAVEPGDAHDHPDDHEHSNHAHLSPIG